MKHVWPEVELGEVCTFNYGKALPAATRSGDGGPVYGSNGVVGFHSATITSGPTIVIGRKGSFGEVHYSDAPCWPIDTTYWIDHTSTSVHLRWLYHRMKSLGLTTLNRAAAVPGLNREDAYRRRFLLPPFDEQQRHADILDRADATRAKRRESLSLFGRLTEALFLSMFGDPGATTVRWPIGAVGDLVASATYGTSRKAGTIGPLPILRMSNITSNGEIDVTDLKRIDLPATEIERHTVRRGDVLFNRTNSADLVGKTALVRFDEQMAYAGYLIRVRVNDRATPEYLAAFMNQRSTKRRLRAMCKSIVGMANINAKEMQTIPVPIPPVQLQREFAARSQATRAKQGLSAAHAAALNELFDSLRQRAFLGVV